MKGLRSASHQLSQETLPTTTHPRERPAGEQPNQAGPGPGTRRCSAVLLSSLGVTARRKGCSHLPSKVGQRTEHKQEGTYRASCVMLRLASLVTWLKLGLFRPQSPPP